MNVKDIAKRMDKKKVYRWGLNAIGNYHLFGEPEKRSSARTADMMRK